MIEGGTLESRLVDNELRDAKNLLKKRRESHGSEHRKSRKRRRKEPPGTPPVNSPQGSAPPTANGPTFPATSTPCQTPSYAYTTPQQTYPTPQTTYPQPTFSTGQYHTEPSSSALHTPTKVPHSPGGQDRRSGGGRRKCTTPRKARPFLCDDVIQSGEDFVQSLTANINSKVLEIFHAGV